jgi:hypothetical protein
MRGPTQNMRVPLYAATIALAAAWFVAPPQIAQAQSESQAALTALTAEYRRAAEEISLSWWRCDADAYRAAMDDMRRVRDKAKQAMDAERAMHAIEVSTGARAPDDKHEALKQAETLYESVNQQITANEELQLVRECTADQDQTRSSVLDAWLKMPSSGPEVRTRLGPMKSLWELDWPRGGMPRDEATARAGAEGGDDARLELTSGGIIELPLPDNHIRVWHFDDETKTWQFRDTRPEFIAPPRAHPPMRYAGMSDDAHRASDVRGEEHPAATGTHESSEPHSTQPGGQGGLREAAEFLFRMEGGVGYRWNRSDRTAFLGRENPITTDRTLGIVKPTRTDSGLSWSLLGSFTTDAWSSGWSNTSFNIGVRYDQHESSTAQSFEPINMMGDTLLLPGVRGPHYPNGEGFALPYFGGLNTVYDAHYGFAQRAWGLLLWLDMLMLCDEFINGSWGSVGFGLGYGQQRFSEQFGGYIPGFARDFHYRTDTQINTWSPMLRFGGEVPLMSMTEMGLRLSLYSLAIMRYDLNRGRGYDRLAFTGFPDQVQPISNNRNTFGAEVNIGLRLALAGGLSVALQGGYRHDRNVPSVVRQGFYPSHLGFGRRDSWDGRAIISLDF